MKKLVRFLLHLAVLFGMVLSFDGLVPTKIGNFNTDGIDMLIFLIPCFFILQLGFDVFGDVENLFLSIIRSILTVGGSIITVLVGLFIQLAQSLETNRSEFSFSPFVAAIFTLGILISVVSIIMYKIFGEMESFLTPFIPVLSFAIAYVINLIFAFLGKYVHSFFYGWFLFVAALALIVVLIVALIKGYDVPILERNTNNYKAKKETYEDKVLSLIELFKNDPTIVESYASSHEYLRWCYFDNNDYYKRSDKYIKLEGYIEVEKDYAPNSFDYYEENISDMCWGFFYGNIKDICENNYGYGSISDWTIDIDLKAK